MATMTVREARDYIDWIRRGMPGVRPRESSLPACVNCLDALIAEAEGWREKGKQLWSSEVQDAGRQYRRCADVVLGPEEE